MREKNAFSWDCICGKTYKYQSGLCKHIKQCRHNIQNETENELGVKDVELDSDPNTYKTMFVKMMEENNEFRNLLIKQQQQIGELIPKVGNNNVSTINTVNQKFNINIFLNEQCKDAINLNDFVKNIEINLDELDYAKNKGLAEGITNTIIEKMSNLSLYERPMHCTDVKRETLYIKNDDIWSKDSSKAEIKRAIKDVSTKQFKTIKKWVDANPDFQKDDLKSEYFTSAVSKLGKDTSTVDSKIIKKICANTYIKNTNTPNDE